MYNNNFFLARHLFYGKIMCVDQRILFSSNNQMCNKVFMIFNL
jgi:hypothetical protein